jgi:nucleotide-binding universal stress UspA family protein
VTVVVGYMAGKCGPAPLHLALEAAQAIGTSIEVVTVVPQPWQTPSLARVDAEFAAWASTLATDSRTEAAEFLAPRSAGVDISYRQVSARTSGEGLVDTAEAVGADALIVGSSADGALGQVVLGATTDWLLHSSPVPVAISPRGYRGARGHKLTRITCAYSGSQNSARVVEQVAEIIADRPLAMRVISFAIRGRTMFPPEVGLHAEDSVLQAWASDLRTMLAGLRSSGVVTGEVQLQVITGKGWAQALDSTEWDDGELLVLGTTNRRGIKGVFLGSHGAKIIRHSPVPVLVLPS